MLKPGRVNGISAYVDSNCGSLHEKNRRSPTGVCVRYGDAPIFVVIKLQRSISLSSTEPEFTALDEGCISVVWLRKVLNELGLNQSTTLVAQDKNGATEWAQGGLAKHFSICKHIDIKFNYVMDLVENDKVKLSKVDTVDMIQDCLKKPLEPKDFAVAIIRAKIF